MLEQFIGKKVRVRFAGHDNDLTGTVRDVEGTLIWLENPQNWVGPLKKTPHRIVNTASADVAELIPLPD